MESGNFREGWVGPCLVQTVLVEMESWSVDRLGKEDSEQELLLQEKPWDKREQESLEGISEEVKSLWDAVAHMYHLRDILLPCNSCRS